MGRRTDVDQSDVYDLVKRADGTVADTFILGVDCRVLLTRNELSVGHERLLSGERVISLAAMKEIVNEMTSKN